MQTKNYFHVLYYAKEKSAISMFIKMSYSIIYSDAEIKKNISTDMHR